MGKLTKRVIDASTPPERGEIFVWDQELRGFGVRIKSTGGKTYLVQDRNAEGHTRRLALGQHGRSGQERLARRRPVRGAPQATATIGRLEMLESC